MSISIAQSRQQLSALIQAARQAPQVITKRNHPVAVLVSPEYFANQSVAIAPASKPEPSSFYSRLMEARAVYLHEDTADTDPVTSDVSDVNDASQRSAAWQRHNPFTEQD